jgi:hypothetical protein
MSIKAKSGGGLDANGYPVEPVANWLAPVPCLVVPAKLNYLAKSSTESAYVDASYTVLIEIETEGVETLQEGERIKIEGWQGNLGEFSVIGIESLTTVGVIKIVV